MTGSANPKTLCGAKRESLSCYIMTLQNQQREDDPSVADMTASADLNLKITSSDSSQNCQSSTSNNPKTPQTAELHDRCTDQIVASSFQKERPSTTPSESYVTPPGTPPVIRRDSPSCSPSRGLSPPPASPTVTRHTPATGQRTLRMMTSSGKLSSPLLRRRLNRLGSNLSAGSITSIGSTGGQTEPGVSGSTPTQADFHSAVYGPSPEFSTTSSRPPENEVKNERENLEMVSREATTHDAAPLTRRDFYGVTSSVDRRSPSPLRRLASEPFHTDSDAKRKQYGTAQPTRSLSASPIQQTSNREQQSPDHEAFETRHRYSTQYASDDDYDTVYSSRASILNSTVLLDTVSASTGEYLRNRNVSKVSVLPLDRNGILRLLVRCAPCPGTFAFRESDTGKVILVVWDGYLTHEFAVNDGATPLDCKRFDGPHFRKFVRLSSKIDFLPVQLCCAVVD